MKRRDFLATTASVLGLTQALKSNEKELKRNGKSAILLWMGGGPSTMDIWDLKPNYRRSVQTHFHLWGC
jgi:hypothetical protein